MEPIALQVKPLAWGEWETKAGSLPAYCTYSNGHFSHHLVEANSDYRYTVQFKGCTILNVVIDLTPYMGDYMRARARVAAYEEWVKFVSSMVGGNQ